MNREELFQAYSIAHLDWERSETYQMQLWNKVKETPEWKAYKEAEAVAQRLWEVKYGLETKCYQECERTGENFYDVCSTQRDEMYD